MATVLTMRRSYPRCPKALLRVDSGHSSPPCAANSRVSERASVPSPRSFHRLYGQYVSRDTVYSIESKQIAVRTGRAGRSRMRAAYKCPTVGSQLRKIMTSVTQSRLRLRVRACVTPSFRDGRPSPSDPELPPSF